VQFPGIERGPDPSGSMPAVLRPRLGGVAERLGRRLERRRPAVAAAIVALVGCLALGAIMVALGAILVHVLLPGSLARWDDSVVRWFAARRTPILDVVSLVCSWLAETLTVVVVGFACAVFLAVKRLWPPFGLLVMSLTVEVLVYLVVTSFVQRHRPFVHELEQRRPYASFPSGHTAAAVAFYFSIAVVVVVVTPNRIVRGAAWTLVVAAPLIVAVARLYRGMHHPTDVLAGYLMGVACVGIGLLAVRVGVAVCDRRAAASSREAEALSPVRARVTGVPVSLDVP
jgi:membrane-associated phospholipid phosphatase